MKMSTLSLIAISIFICLATISYYNTQTEANVATVKRQYRTYMQAACESAMNSIDLNKGMIFEAEADRQKVVKTFFETLAGAFNREGEYADEILQYVPVIALVDYDGFYVWHRRQINKKVSEFYSWSEAVDKYVIRYYLGEQVKITDTNTGIVYYGNGEEVYNLINNPVLSFLNDEKELEFRRSQMIIATVKNKIEYYINIDESNRLSVGYEIVFAEVDNDDWGRLLRSPTIFAFLQGKQLEEINSDIVLNIYSFSGTEITGTYHYFIDQTNCYHCLEEMMDNEKVMSIGSKYYYNGEIISKIYNSMEECARLGAYPGVK